MQFIQVQDPGPDGSMTHPITIVSLTSDEVQRLMTYGVVHGIQPSGDALIVAVHDDQDRLMEVVRESVERIKGPIDVFKVGGD